MSSLSLACENGDLDTVKRIVSVGFDVGQINRGFILSAKYGYLEIVKYLANAGKPHINIHVEDDMAFQLACCYGHFEIVKFLVENGANIHASSDYGFVYADIRGHWNILNFLRLKANTRTPYDATGTTCFVCLDENKPPWTNKASVWGVYPCGHKVCSDCFPHLARCPLRC